MYARAVRFTDVSPDSIESVRSRVDESDGPPPGVKSTAMKLLYDADQSTAIFIGFFETEEDMHDADAIFQAMDGSDTPGTRASIDQAEVVIEREMGDRA
jgi:hypothetical protein